MPRSNDPDEWLPEQVCNSTPAVPWAEIRGANIGHVYDHRDTADEIAWSVVSESIPQLVAALKEPISEHAAA